MTARFEVHTTKDGRECWAHVRSGNGQVTWQTETYPEHASAEKAIWSHVSDMANILHRPTPASVVYYEATVTERGDQPPAMAYEQRLIEDRSFR